MRALAPAVLILAAGTLLAVSTSKTLDWCIGLLGALAFAAIPAELTSRSP